MAPEWGLVGNFSGRVGKSRDKLEWSLLPHNNLLSYHNPTYPVNCPTFNDVIEIIMRNRQYTQLA